MLSSFNLPAGMIDANEMAVRSHALLGNAPTTGFGSAPNTGFTVH